jgi:hypothetical protein
VLLRAVPRAAARHEDAPAILGREHLAGIESHAQRRRVRSQRHDGLGHALAGIGLLDVLIGNAHRVAVGEAEILAGPTHAVQLFLGAVLVLPVAAVVGEPELARLGVEVEAHRIAHAAGHHFHARAVGIVAADLRVVGRGLADVAGGSDRHIELAVGSEGQELPAVVPFGRQLERRRHVDRLRRAVELVLDAVETQHLVDRGDVERAVAEGQPVGLGRSLDQDLVRALAALVGDRVDAVDGARADEDRALVAARHHARAGHAMRPQLDLEALRHLEPFEWDLVGRRHRHARRMRRELAVRHALRAALRPGRRLLLRESGKIERQRGSGH